MLHSNTINRALNVKHILDQYFEPENQSRCMLAVWRSRIYSQFAISIATYYRYIAIATSIEGFIGTGSNRINRMRRPLKIRNSVQLSFNFN